MKAARLLASEITQTGARVHDLLANEASERCALLTALAFEMFSLPYSSMLPLTIPFLFVLFGIPLLYSLPISLVLLGLAWNLVSVRIAHLHPQN